MDAFPPDQVLLEVLRAGDEDLFALMLIEWSPGMLRLAGTFTRSHIAAEEVVQEAWIAVIRGLDGFAGRSSLRTWVFRILINIAKTHAIGELRVIPVDMSGFELTVDPDRFRDVSGTYVGYWREGAAPQPWPDEHVLTSELRGVILDALDALPAQSRAVITLRDVQGCSAAETCSLLDLSPINQRVVLHRARAVVRGKVERYYAIVDEERRELR